VAPAVLAEVPLRGRVVTGDALYACRKMCRQVVEAEGDYLFIVKGNCAALYDDMRLLFDEPPFGEQFDTALQTEKLKGRVETRELKASSALSDYLDWPGVTQVCQVRRTTVRKGERSEETRYAITSLSVGADELLRVVRGHWAIENRLHRVRDVTMGEDASQIRTGSAPEVMAALRNGILGALRLLKHDNIAAALRSIAWQQRAVALVASRSP
jgi:predicted transposase YbfD/YdcC